MMEKAKKDCIDCKFWVAPRKYCGFKTGECRRNSPIAGRLITQRWPRTKPDDWCGDYKAKPKAKETTDTLRHRETVTAEGLACV